MCSTWELNITNPSLDLLQPSQHWPNVSIQKNILKQNVQYSIMNMRSENKGEKIYGHYFRLSIPYFLY